MYLLTSSWFVRWTTSCSGGVGSGEPGGSGHGGRLQEVGGGRGQRGPRPPTPHLQNPPGPSAQGHRVRRGLGGWPGAARRRPWRARARHGRRRRPVLLEMRAPKSKKAAAVQLKANPSCRIWFVCKGKLICTREASEEGLVSRGEPSTASTSPRPTASDCSTSASSSHRHRDEAAEPVGIHGSTTPSQHHDSGDAMDMDSALAVESMPGTDGDQGFSVLRFGLPELEEATGRFHESARIGSAGNGRAGVYRGSLRGTRVAVRVISPDAAVGEARFARETDAIGRVRHPGLVALVGACPEARAVVHELVPGGSLEDRLAQGGDGTPPLLWRARCAVACQVCSVLAFLHSSAKTVHGDVRLTNILLLDDDDEHRPSGSKLAGLGMRGLVSEQQRAGREALAYVDPRYLATGEPTPQWDVHALGLLLLRLVTGLPARWAKKVALEAAAGGGRAWHQVVDASARGWPTEVATEVALLGLRCCAVSDGRVACRPAGELLEEARAVLEATMDAASLLSSAEKEASNGGGARPVLHPLPDNEDPNNLCASSSRSTR
ncbi:hypothetical protein ACQJBY_067230 [Aegilops geniculata]